ncbi:RagB/SusD family nutrient uptake outer membrane protein [Belliella sp. R4-6]|uniref:RagB/SusD family nutrient uptake outer membrane protein n=1 Tax=Belliella alkalica TaxID=1730871 RepID=A0ABS9V615_9BACT|nr:RagB/SusD family nutrient uptake outer membrane protein [Belliella alkalica]MCH7411856.1 RagB/SusD family nutrient uptake outer membrane protein [Belliella alkalica]
MDKIKNTINYLLIFGWLAMGCSGFLDEKPDLNMVVPESIEDLRALLDNDVNVMSQDPAYHEVTADNFIVLEQVVNNLPIAVRNAYLWENDIFEGASNPDWRRPYEQIFYSNVVLDQLELISVQQFQSEEFNDLKGSALFYRAYNHFNLMRVFCQPYRAGVNDQGLGIPIRNSSNVNLISSRARLIENLEAIISDLETSLELLPDFAIVKTRPSKNASYALLSRVYLYVGLYQEALDNAEMALGLNRTLLDYNQINPALTRPFVRLNEEVVFNAYMLTLASLVTANALINPELYDSFETNDLRKRLYFNNPNPNHGLVNFRGSYMGDARLFTGLANDELYLIAAECHARLGDLDKAKGLMNEFLGNRYLTGTFQSISESNQTELVRVILMERRKSLMHRGIRWSDLKRLSFEPEFAETLTRTHNGKVLTLSPGDLRFAFEIPLDEIEVYGLEQNPR